MDGEESERERELGRYRTYRDASPPPSARSSGPSRRLCPRALWKSRQDGEEQINCSLAGRLAGDK